MQPIELLTDVSGSPKRIGQLILQPSPTSVARPSMAFRYDDEWRVHGFALGADLPLTSGIHYPAPNARGGAFGFVADHAPASWVRSVCQKADLNGFKHPFSELAADVPDLWTAMTSRPGAFSSLYSTKWRGLWQGRNAALMPSDAPRSGDSRKPHRILARRLEALQTRPAQDDFDFFWRCAAGTFSVPALYWSDDKGAQRSVRSLAVLDALDPAMTAAVTASLARACGVDVVPGECVGIGLYAALRIDRTFVGEPLFCLSAASLLSPSPQRPVCVLDVVDILNCAGARPREDLEQLFRRVLFDALLGSSCTRPQAVWFTPDTDGWRLLPVDFVCPVLGPVGAAQSPLPLISGKSAADPEAVVGVSRYFGIPSAKAKSLLMEFRHALGNWKHHAKSCGADFMTEMQLRRLFEK